MEMRIFLWRTTLVFAFILLILSCRDPNPQEAAGEESSVAAPVKVIAVKRDRISEELHKTGLIKAWREINITPVIGGQIAKIYVQEGEEVKEGQLMAELDTRAFRLQLEQAEAGVAVAEANFRDAKRNMDRMERLNLENAVSEQQYEKVKLLYEAAEAQLQQARAALNLANYNIEVSMMKAPFSGVVASRNAEEGDVFNPMMAGFLKTSGILTLMDYSRIKIEVEVPERDVLLIKRGQPAHVAAMAYPGKPFQGVVHMVNHTADPVSKKFSITVVIENPNLQLKPNTFGEVTFVIEQNEDALVIPAKAVLEKQYVFTVEGNAVKKIMVTLGLQSDDWVEVTKGLREGDLVVSEGNFGLEEGMKIEILEIFK